MTDNATGDDEWRYYQRDGATLVRQTTNQIATITLAWTFSPEGGVVLGEEGPVTHLGCQDDAVYDWSTGLIFKGGRYYDPSLGIWLTGPLMIIVGLWRPRKRRKKKKGRLGRGQRIISLLLVLILVTIPLTGCRKDPPQPPPQQEKPSPTATEACTPEATTPTPGLPTETPNPPTPTESPIPTQPPTNTPPPTSTLPPTGTPSPTPTPAPTIWTASPVQTDGIYPDWMQWYGKTVFSVKSYRYGTVDGAHPGLDFGVYYNQFKKYDPNSTDPNNGTIVYARTSGTIRAKRIDTIGLGRVEIALDDVSSYGYYEHLEIDVQGNVLGSPPLNSHVEPGDEIGYLGQFDEGNGVGWETKKQGHTPHVHLELRNADNTVSNPLPHFSNKDDLIARFNKNFSGTSYPPDHEQNPLDQPPNSFR